MNLKKNKEVFLILLTFFIIKLVFFKRHLIWWDESVYIGMSKYIYSLGSYGLWEDIRPLLWPIMIFGSTVFARILVLVLSLACIYLTYLIAKRLFNKNTALIATMMLAFNPVFFFYSGKILAGIAALFFILLSFYFFINKRDYLAGLFIGLAFLTRFPAGIFLVILFIPLLLYWKKKDLFIKKAGFFILGFLTVVIPFLIFNYFYYGQMLKPLITAFYTINRVIACNYLYVLPWYYYFLLLLGYNFLVIFAIIGIYLLRKRDLRKYALLLSFIIPLIYITLLHCKQERYVLMFLPFLMIVTAFALVKLFSKIKNKQVACFISILIALILLVIFTTNLASVYQKEQQTRPFYADINVSKGELVMTTMPYIINYKDVLVLPLYYYNPYYIKDVFYNNIYDVNYVIFDTCDIPCSPVDENCPAEMESIKDVFTKTLNRVYYEKKNGCERFIFHKPT